MTQAAKAHEPTMEEILASIRRIIADDDAKPASAAAPTQAQAAAPAQPQEVPPSSSAAAPTPAQLLQQSVDNAVTDGGTPQDIAEQSADILDLTESMVAAAPAAPAALASSSFQTIKADLDVVFADGPEAETAERPTEQAKPAEQAAAASESPLLSSEAHAAVHSAFNTLAHTVLVQNARTLEDLVREMLRPLLKAWLDDNLPSIVERLVRMEIERVSRGHR